MKKMIYVLPVIALFAVMVGFFGVSQGDPNADQSPTLNSEFNNEITQTDTTRPAGFPYPTQWNFPYASVANLNAGTVGALLLYGNYYFNRWNGTDCYILPNTGNNFGPSTTGQRTVPYTGQIRDMTTDGRYLYGGKASTIIYKMDTNLTIVTQYSVTGNARAIGYDRSRKAFWICDFAGAVTCRDSANVLKGSITTTLAAKYGCSYDSTDHNPTTPDSGFVYVWDQNTNTQGILHRYYVTPSVPTLLNNWVFTLPGASVGIPGGAEINIDNAVTPPRKMLILNYQNFALVGYKMSDVIQGLNNTNEVVRDFALNQNYPNPFNPVTNISFTLRQAGHVKLDIYNAVGEHVRTIFNGYTQAGDHELVYDASNLSSGVYYYTITFGDFKDSRKMMLVK
jgi:hypothetical protein